MSNNKWDGIVLSICATALIIAFLVFMAEMKGCKIAEQSEPIIEDCIDELIESKIRIKQYEFAMEFLDEELNIRKQMMEINVSDRGQKHIERLEEMANDIKEIMEGYR